MCEGVVGKDLMRNRGSVMLRLPQLRMSSMFSVLSRYKQSMLSRMASLKRQRHCASGKAQTFKMPSVPQIKGRPP